VAFTAWSLLAPLARKFEDDYGLTNTETSILIAIPVVLGSLLRIPVGTLTDRFGGRRMFALLLLASAPPAVLLGYADSYWSLIAVGFSLGISGSSFAIGVPFVAGWYPKERQGFAVGVYGMGNIGTAVAAFGAPALAVAAGPPVLGWVAGVLLAATSALMWFAAEDPTRAGKPVRYRDVLRSGWRLYRLALFYFLTFGGFVAMSLYLPKLLKDWFGLSLVDAGLRAAGFTILATAARPLGSWLADRVNPSLLLLIVFGVVQIAVLVVFLGIAIGFGTSGTVGPNLDDLMPSVEQVLAAIENGGAGSGQMPAGLLAGDDARSVADLVASAAGGTGNG
jgi:NNP family nitrate/nitrite transporter-like MFS transporter